MQGMLLWALNDIKFFERSMLQSLTSLEEDVCNSHLIIFNNNGGQKIQHDYCRYLNTGKLKDDVISDLWNQLAAE
jgi:hypothetical protein